MISWLALVATVGLYVSGYHLVGDCAVLVLCVCVCVSHFSQVIMDPCISMYSSLREKLGARRYSHDVGTCIRDYWLVGIIVYTLHLSLRGDWSLLGQ